MADLLPIKEHEALKLERRRRLRAAAFILIAGIAFLGTLLVIPSIIVLATNKETLEKRLETTKGLVALQKDADAGALIASTKDKMDILSKNEASLVPHDLIGDITGLLPSGVTLSQVSFTRDPSQVELVLSGQAATRDALLAFGDALKGSGLFTDVTIPIESLAQNTNLHFRLTLVLAGQQPKQ